MLFECLLIGDILIERVAPYFNSLTSNACEIMSRPGSTTPEILRAIHELPKAKRTIISTGAEDHSNYVPYYEAMRKTLENKSRNVTWIIRSDMDKIVQARIISIASEYNDKILYIDFDKSLTQEKQLRGIASKMFEKTNN